MSSPLSASSEVATSHGSGSVSLEDCGEPTIVWQDTEMSALDEELKMFRIQEEVLMFQRQFDKRVLVKELEAYLFINDFDSEKVPLFKPPEGCKYDSLVLNELIMGFIKDEDMFFRAFIDSL